MRRNDPRLRQTLNQISQNIESANLSTQASLYTFSQEYVSPCLASLNTCLEASCQPCFAYLSTRENQRHPHRGSRRGRDDLGFDFYDDWDEEEGNWGNDELDRLLAGSDEQPKRRAGMSYGTGVARRKTLGIPRDGGTDPNMVPKSSMFGFLERLPWKIGGRSVRYRPSAADLQENVGKGAREAEPLMEESEESIASVGRGRHGRNRSGTANSRSTTNSLSSRGDLFPSEDEDDAVPLDDEFAMVLGRRNTGPTSDDHSSRKSKKRRPGTSPLSTKTVSSKDTRAKRKLSSSPSKGEIRNTTEAIRNTEASIGDLKQEEEQAREEEEAEVESKRKAAQALAVERGLAKTEETQDQTPAQQDNS
ncbi:MAG: hypothetical protein HETSPECPRED_006095 [Heterodermia speciosa]|uniref:Uncharacterized protein n=1 Tax=Heterodermia speciosa TaxID=116794 RepID=A0A8H3ELC9_9LECA|nr:MAG: hypothetical protein HETSPECPRED_006095 [Heterodermia speciosa]